MEPRSDPDVGPDRQPAARQGGVAGAPATTDSRAVQLWHARLWLAVVLLLVTAVVTLRAGFWQLGRADEKRAVLAQIEAASALAPLPLSPSTPTEDFVEWRRVWARGAWQPAWTVLLQNRNQGGVSGYWVVTPLCLDSPDAPEASAGRFAVDCDRAVAVLRGWVPRKIVGVRQRPGAGLTPARTNEEAAADGVEGVADAALALPDLPTLPPTATVDGRLLARVPRVYELMSLRGEPKNVLQWDAGQPPVVQNLDLEEYAAATGLDLLPMVLQQSSGDDDLVRDWQRPRVDVDTHLGYALQWFSFAAIALIALGVVLVKAFKHRRR